MARPALLIGLGGTGQWVLTYVKKELQDYTKGEGVPGEVRLIAFDTTRQIDENKADAGEEEKITVEGVTLDSNEYYHVGGNIEKIVREIAEEQMHPHIASWLQAKSYLTRLSAGQYNLEEGAGQMRPFGRMAIFKDLESNPDNSRIFGTIRSAIQEIRKEVKENRSLEISIIASLAGGTGAGMAVDIAHIVRTIAEDAINSDNFVIRGFFVLPRAFHRIPGGDGPNMRARAFAAVRELSRFITVFGDREYPMVYNPTPQFREDFQKPVKKRLFDLCYLVDAHRDRNSLDDVAPKHGVFPSIADAILGFVDESSGQEHTEHVNNVMPQLTKGDDIAYFSAIGTYAFDLPVLEIAEENSGKLALDFLKRLLKPEFDDEGRVIRLSAEHNREIPDKQPVDLVEGFMKNPDSGENTGKTLFLAHAAKLLEKGGLRNNQLLEETATRTSVEWLIFIEPDDAADTIRDLRTEVRTILENSLSTDVKTSGEQKNEKHEFGCERIEKDVEKYLAKYLGKRQPDGGTAGGKFRVGLEKYVNLQLERFRKSLGGYCLTLLNGSSQTDPELAKSGKIGFVLEFLDKLSRQVETFCTFMTKVGEIRRREGRLGLKREEVQEARSRMIEDRGKSGFLQKAAENAQRQFIQLMDEQVELEKDEMIFKYVHHIAQQYRDLALSLKGVLDRWTRILALGETEQPGLYEVINTNLQKVKAKRERARNFSRVRREETDNDFEQRLYRRFAKDELDDIFKSARWTLKDEGKSFGLEIMQEPIMLEKVRERDRPTEHNQGILLRKTGGAFQRIIREETIVKRLMDRYSEEDLSKKLYENGSPLISFSTNCGQPSNFLTVKHGTLEGDEAYFRQVVEKVSGRSGAKGDHAKLVSNDGVYKCTLIYTIDVIKAGNLSAYEDLAGAYKKYVDDRRLLHNFPAEVNAVHYEQQVRDKLRKPYRMFNPRIVFMLEYKQWVRQFARCCVYGIITQDKDGDGNRYWAIHLPKCEHKGKSYPAEVLELTPHVERKADFLKAMNTFVFRKKDFRREFDIPIQYQHLVKALLIEEEKVGDDAANILKLESVIESGFISDFKHSGDVFEQDLGDLMHVMLLDEIERLTI